MSFRAEGEEPQRYAYPRLLAFGLGRHLGRRVTPRGTSRSTPRGTRASTSRAAGVQGGAVPMAALLEAHGDSAWVLTLGSRQDTLPVRRRVRVAGVAGDRALVEGVPPGTLVVARGAAFVTPGALVHVQAGRPVAEGLLP